MEKYSPDILRVLSQIEKEITKVEEELKCLEDKGALHEINEHMRRSQNVLYQAQMVIAEKLSSVVAEQSSIKFKNRPLKGNQDKNENTGSASATSNGICTAYNASASNTVSIAVPKTYGHSTNGLDSVEGYNEGNASLLNNSEEPVPLELRPTPIPTQQQDPEIDIIPITTPSQDSSYHTTLDQHDDSCAGQILLSPSLGQPEREAKSTIASFTAEFTATVYQQLPEDSPPYLILPPAVCIINPIQESHGQWNMIKLSNTHQARHQAASEEKQFVLLQFDM